MRVKLYLLLILSLSLLQGISSAATQQWLHLHVENANKQETVKVNIPLSLVETMLPLVEEKRIKDGKIRLNEKDIRVKDLRNVWKEIRDQGDSEYVSIENAETNLRVYTEGDYLYVRPEKPSRNNVDIKLPLSVVDAMLSGEGDELNLLAAVRELKRTGTRNLITVKSPDSTLIVWIDENNKGR